MKHWEKFVLHILLKNCLNMGWGLIDWFIGYWCNYMANWGINMMEKNKGRVAPLLTIFTTAKPFTNHQIRVIQNNAFSNWDILKPRPEVIVFGNEAGVKEACLKYGFIHVPNVAVDECSCPLASEMFQKAKELAKSDVLLYVNSDILFADNSINKLAVFLKKKKVGFFVTGVRNDVSVDKLIEFRGNWANKLFLNSNPNNSLAKDYFLFNKNYFDKVPDLVVGKYYWDNWFLHNAIVSGKPVIDATKSVLVFHQNHPKNPSLENYSDVAVQKNLALLGGNKEKVISRVLFVPNEVVPVKKGFKVREKKEGLDWKGYLKRYPDLKANGIVKDWQAIEHWFMHGNPESRILEKKGFVSSKAYDWKDYLERYPDLKANGVLSESQAFVHWAKHGVFEEREVRLLNRKKGKNSNKSDSKERMVLEKTMNHYKKFPKKLPGAIWGIVAYFNPMGYKNKYENFVLFRKSLKKQGLKIIVVELEFDESPFEIKKNDAEILVQLRADRKKSTMWQKEALLSIALKHLPKDCDKVVWMDSDIVFLDNGWVKKTAKALEDYIIVHPFRLSIQLKNGESPFKKINEADYKYGYLTGKKAFGSVYWYSNKNILNSISDCRHPGYVWAARREYIERVGFFDLGIIGSGDTYMFFGFSYNNTAWIFQRLSIKLARAYKRWVIKARKNSKNSLGYIDGIIVHLWHGEKQNRFYNERQIVLIKHDFDPKKDIKKNKDGVFEWASKKSKLFDDVNNYFLARGEESTKIVSKLKIEMVDELEKETGVKYDWEDYLKRYPDLKKSNVHTVEDAIRHWLNHGKKEDRILLEKK